MFITNLFGLKGHTMTFYESGLLDLNPDGENA